MLGTVLLGVETLGTEPSGTVALGIDAPGTEPPGTEPFGAELLGTESSGTESLGVELLGIEALGTESSGTESLGDELLGIEGSGTELVESGALGDEAGTVGVLGAGTTSSSDDLDWFAANTGTARATVAAAASAMVTGCFMGFSLHRDGSGDCLWSPCGHRGRADFQWTLVVGPGRHATARYYDHGPVVERCSSDQARTMTTACSFAMGTCRR